MQASWRAAIVVGASSGIGEAIARRLAADRVKVALVARRGALLDKLAKEFEAAGVKSAIREHDVRNGAEVPELWTGIEKEIGVVDLVVFAAGIGIPVEPSEYTWAKDRAMFDTNLVGAAAWLDEAAVRMEAARRGTIVGISSVAGDRGRRGTPAYCASKAGMTTFLESLRNRLHRHGVRVVTIRPGYVATPMTAHMNLPKWAVISSERAAELILRAAGRGSVDVRVPWPWNPVMWIIRLLPSFIFRKLSI